MTSPEELQEPTDHESGRRRVGRHLAVFIFYLAFAIPLFGWGLWPHPGRGIVGLTLVADPEAFIWEFGWWAHALSTFTNPFVTNVIYSPVGANLIWTATAPGLGLLFAPLTWLVGPTATYNIVSVLGPALTAWTTFLLCRYLTKSTWAALVAGYLFGFSSYVISHVFGGDPNMIPALLPLVALALLRYLRSEINGRGLAWRMGVLLALEFVISTEITLTISLAIFAGLLLAFALAPDLRRRIVSGIGPIVASYGIAGVITAPFVYYALSDFQLTDITKTGDGDLLNIVLPTRLVAVGGSTFEHVTSRFNDTIIDADMYIGIPALIIFALYVWRARRSIGARFLLISLLVAWICSLGAALRYEGRRIGPAPWALAEHIHLLANLVETRLTVYATLAASVGVALWIATTRGRLISRPVVLPVLAVAALIPASWSVASVRSPLRVAFFSQGLYKICVPKGENLAIFPYGRFGDSNIYQAESGFWFKMAEGNLGRDRYPAKFVFSSEIEQKLQFFWAGPRPSMQELLVWAKANHVDRVVSLIGPGYPDTTQMHEFGPEQIIGGVAIAPGCGYDSLAGDKRRIPGQG